MVDIFFPFFLVHSILGEKLGRSIVFTNWMAFTVTFSLFLPFKASSVYWSYTFECHVPKETFSYIRAALVIVPLALGLSPVQSCRMSIFLHGAKPWSQILPKEKRVNRDHFGTKIDKEDTFGEQMLMILSYYESLDRDISHRLCKSPPKGFIL